MRVQIAWIVLIVAALLATPGAGAATRPASIPPDGNAGPVVTLAAVASGKVAAGTEVTTQTSTVTSLSCPSCDEATVAADFRIKDASGGSVRVHVPNTFQATWNVKKQNFVPLVGMPVVVQGVVGHVNGEWLITMKRFADVGHPGPTVHAYEVAAGRFPTGTFVWLDPVKVLNRGHWDDGDITWDMRDPAGGGLVHVELTPPYWGQLRVLNVGDTVTPYGEVRFDPDHNWWELHPVRCWSHSECVPTVAGFVRNGPPPGTPATTATSTGFYEQGGPVPLSTPLSSGSSSGTGVTTSGGLAASFAKSLNPNEWWVEVMVHANQPIVGVDASANGGPWIALSATSWGTWAKSFFVPAGSHVQFRAHSSTGATATSVSYAWP